MTRKLVQINEDDPLWDNLPKDIRALPVYFRKTKTGIEVWPIWPDYVAFPTVEVDP